RSSLEDSLSRKESEMLAALERLNTIKQRQREVEEGARDAEEDLRSLVRQRESEIESLTRRNQVLNDALSRLTSVDAYAIETGTLGSSSATSTVAAGAGGIGFPAIPRLVDRGRELAASLGADSWQTASDSSFSSTFGAGAGNPFLGPEAPTSIFADRSTGFEPPAPPSVEPAHSQPRYHSHDERKEPLVGSSSSMGGSGDDRHGRHDDFPTSNRQEGRQRDADGADNLPRRSSHDPARAIHQTPGDQGERDIQGGALITSPGSHFFAQKNSSATTGAGAKTRVPAVRTPKSNSVRGGVEVLHGVSAALASGALPTPVAAHLPSNPKTTETEYPSDGNAESLDPLPHSPSNFGECAGGLRLYSEGLRDGASTGGGNPSTLGREVGGSVSAHIPFSGDDDASRRLGTQGLAGNRRTDDGGAQARQQIDQALRERALRRRNSDGQVQGLPGQELPSKRATSGSTSSAATAANLAFRASMQPEFRPNAGGTILGENQEGARFINLGATTQRSGGGGIRQGLPGRQGGGAVARARSAVVVPNGTSSAAPKKSSAARIYGMPQNSR
ncbi:unnamed protein product, partial [Hapterophycus canaliculatus]